MKDDDPFADPSWLDPVDSDQHEGIMKAVQIMVQQAKDNGLPQAYHQRLENILLNISTSSESVFHPVHRLTFHLCVLR